MATETDSSTPPEPQHTPCLLSIWLVSQEVAELHAEMELRNKQRAARAAQIGKLWRPLSLAETAELLIGELLRTRAAARKEG